MQHRNLDGRTRLAIGPANYAGQAYQWAEAVKRSGVADSFSFAVGDDGVQSGLFGFPIHQTLAPGRFSRIVARRREVDVVLQATTHVLIDGFLRLFGPGSSPFLRNDIRRLQAQGLYPALLAHGSDVRNPDGHMARHEFSYFHDAPSRYVNSLRNTSSRNRRIAVESGVPLFVSTPDLLNDLPSATWLPLVIEVDRWTTPAPVLLDDKPAVLHVPSKRVPPIKGSEWIEPVLRTLSDQGRISYHSPNNVSHSQMADLVRSSDIVVDQLLTGSYGVAAVEAMAAGKLVVGNVGLETRSRIPDFVPIVDVGPTEFSFRMEDILANPETFRPIAESGPAFAGRWHDGTEAAHRLKPFLQLAELPSPGNRQEG